jgi:hypothetical protein
VLDEIGAGFAGEAVFVRFSGYARHGELIPVYVFDTTMGITSMTETGRRSRSIEKAKTNPKTIRELGEAYMRWRSLNAPALEDGGYGDIVALLAALNAALPKA